MSAFNVKEYWEKRVSKTWDLSSVGYLGMGTAYNGWMYRIRAGLFKKHVFPLLKKKKTGSILDVGSGTGFYIQLWSTFKDAFSITGLDLTEVNTTNLQKKFPSFTFHQADISAAQFNSTATYDFISCFDVLFHVVDDTKFEQALQNFNQLLNESGYLIISDNLIQGKKRSARHHVNRNQAYYRQALQANGFKVLTEKPMFYFMNEPVEDGFTFLKKIWGLQLRLVGKFSFLGAVLGCLLYITEFLTVRLTNSIPSTRILVCIKEA